MPDRVFATDGTVDAIAPAGNTVYIGGEFKELGTPSGPGVALSRATGRLRPAFPTVAAEGQGPGNGVYVVIADGAGGWYLGGGGITVGGVARHGMAHVLSDGRVDKRFDPKPDNSVLALAISGRTLYAGGYFDRIGGRRRPRLAALDSTTGRAKAWNPAVGDVDVECGDTTCGENAPIAALAVSRHTLYAGGSFNSIGGRPRHRIAALDAASGHATGWNPDATAEVDALVISGGQIYAGGRFDRVGGQRRAGIAALDTATGRATGWDPNARPERRGGNANVGALAVSGRNVYAGGDFGRIGGRQRHDLAALSTATGRATGWNPGADGAVEALAVSRSTVYVGGYFGTIGGRARHHLAALNASTGAATEWSPEPDADVGTLAVSDRTVFAGGSFRLIDTQYRQNLAALDPATGRATDWNPGASSDVDELAVSGSTVYAAGQFRSIGGKPRNELAAVDAVTGFPTDWNPDPKDKDGNLGRVNALAVSGATVYVAGNFSSIGGQERHSLAALDATTGVAAGWNPNPEDRSSSAGAVVGAMTISGPTLYVSGSFTSIGGQPRASLAALDATTGAATDWNPQGTRTPKVLVAGPGSAIYAGGDFQSIGGKPRNGVAALDATTGATTDWNPNPNDHPEPAHISNRAEILGLAVSGSTVYAGGTFDSIGGQPRNGVAALDASTAAATDWNPMTNLQGHSSVTSVLAASGGTVYVAGYGPLAPGISGIAEFTTK